MLQLILYVNNLIIMPLISFLFAVHIKISMQKIVFLLLYLKNKIIRKIFVPPKWIKTQFYTHRLRCA